MLLGGNIGFWCSAVVVVLGWLVGRWKWRRVASRREEVKRLMMLASEEAARAELESASGNGSYAALAPEEPSAGPGSSPPVQKLQHQCEVCFSPTATRCKQCKAVRYCSRKCQVLHWRQGHKDECHPVSTHQYIDLRVHSRLKEFNRDGIETSRDGIQVMLNTEPVESSSNKLKFSNPILHVPGENNDPEIAPKDDQKQTDMNVKSLHLSDEKSSPTFSTDIPVASDTNYKVGDKYDGIFLTENPSLTTPKTGCIDEKYESPSSFDSEQHSLSKPSPSSDFWAGTVEPKKSSINAPEFDDVKKPNSCPSALPSSGRKTNVRVDMLGSDVNIIQTDDSCPDTSIPRKSAALQEVNEDGLKAKEPVFNCKLPSQNGLSSKKVAKLHSSNAHHKRFSEEGPVRNKHVDNVSSLQSLPPKVVNHQVDGKSDVLDSLKCQQKDYSSRQNSSVAHLPSIVSIKKTTTVPDGQPVDNKKGTHEDASRSLDIRGYVRVATRGTNQLEMAVVDKLRVSSFSKPSSVGAGSCTMGRYEGSFPYELFVKLYNWNKVELLPRGLKNCGNSCYANAVLQCLAFTPPLTAYFLQGLHAKTCRKKEWCFMCELEALIKKAKEGNYPLSPASLLSHMHQAASHLGNGREEDAHEFLRYAIDAMQLVCLKDAPVNMPNSLDDEDTTLLGLTFGGYLDSKIECMKCGGISKQHERIMDLTIEIGGDIRSLEDALRHFTRSEILDGENKYHCDRCKSYVRAKKKLRVLEAPNILTIALKRFQSGEFGKLNKSVKFPEFLNLATYMRGTSDKSPIYQLYGAVVHLDVKNATFTGHYVCYVKNNQGKWFKADDSLVQSVELEKVLSNDAYMLFYSRCSPRAPKPIRSSLKPPDLRKSSKDLTTSKIKFHLPEPWDFSSADLNKLTSTNGPKSSRSNSEDEERSSSLFSESCSHSTDSSNRESSSTDESLFDHRDMDSDNPSPPSSVSSPVRTRHSPLADLGRYSSISQIDGDGFLARTSSISSSSKVNSCRTNENGNLKGVYVRSMR